MSLLILIYTLMSSLAPMAGISQGMGMEEQAPAPQVLVLEAQAGEALDAATTARMEQALRQRFSLVGMNQIKLTSVGNRYSVELPGALAQQLAELPAMQSELEQLLNAQMSLQILRVHPHSDRVLRHGRVRDAIDAYERAMSIYESGLDSKAEEPELPALPERLNLPDYMLAEQPVISSADAAGHYEYLVLQRPEAAAEDEVLIDEKLVEKVEVQTNGVSITFTADGAARLHALTSSMKQGQDRLALVLDGCVVSAPIVHAPLRKTVLISGLSESERELLSSGFGIPLPVPVRIVELRPAP